MHNSGPRILPGVFITYKWRMNLAIKVPPRSRDCQGRENHNGLKLSTEYKVRRAHSSLWRSKVGYYQPPERLIMLLQPHINIRQQWFPSHAMWWHMLSMAGKSPHHSALHHRRGRPALEKQVCLVDT